MKIKKGHIILSIPVIIVFSALIFLLSGAEKEQNIVTGIVETTEIDVASKIPGRIEKMFFEEGQLVKKGDIIASLESKEIDAKVEQARGVMDAAREKMNLTNKGAREEEKRGAEKLYLQAKHQFNYVNKTWERFQKLYKDSVISEQERDEIEFKYNAALEQMEAAKAKYDMALNGARPEEKLAAAALFHQAENVFIEAMTYKDELSLKAPIDGEISRKIVDAGEIISAGYPIVSLINRNDSYIVLQLREDKLGSIKLGQTFKGKVPGLRNEEFVFEVTFISAMADFATWKPTNQKGEFDLKTFEIHLRNKRAAPDLRPGMTVNILLSN
ncbi:MAG: efflux RND transporter periplasmic adaptor subunit [Bacteroidetes bacterium]|nr:efflux RND transporter periplasmic adaptor subunit [Bacteroidota bacterium]